MYEDVAKNLEFFQLEYPETIVPNPTEEDYTIGFINRYFLRIKNDQYGHIFEVNEEVYTKYTKNPFWFGQSIQWRIAGPLYEILKPNGDIGDRGVLASNKASIGTATQLKNLKLYLPNLKQFYKGV